MFVSVSVASGFVMAAAAPEFAFLMQKENVPAEAVDALVGAGVTTVRQFAVLAKDADEIRQLAADSLGLGDGKSLQSRVKHAALVCAFNAAKARAAEADRTDAENECRAQPKVVPIPDFIGMKKAFGAKFRPLDDGRCPARSYIEAKLDALEKGDFRAEKLSEVVALREDNREGMAPVWGVKVVS